MRPAKKPPSDGLGSIHVGEIAPVRVFARRLGWSRPSISAAKQAGLKTVRVGRFDITTGEWVKAFLERQADARQSEEGGTQ